MSDAARRSLGGKNYAKIYAGQYMTRFPASDPKAELWHALSDLFLDTEVRWFLPRCAYQAVKIGLDADQLDRALTDEVAPAVCDNLLGVAGEWAGFELEWLLQQMETAARQSWLRRQAIRPLLTLYLPPLRSTLRSLHEYLCLFPEKDREGEATRLEALARLYLELDWRRAFTLWNCLKKLAISSWSEIESSWWHGIHPSFAPLLKPRSGNEPTFENCTQNFSWLTMLFAWLQERDLPTPEGMALGEQLSYAFIVENLAQTPRAQEVRAQLSAMAYPRGLLEAMISEPLDALYKDKERALGNLTAVLNATCPTL